MAYPNQSVEQLPSEEQILAAYEKLFTPKERVVSRFKVSGLRYVTFPNGIILVEQNPAKQSNWAEMARSGHQIAWLMQDGNYLARVVDGKVEILN